MSTWRLVLCSEEGVRPSATGSRGWQRRTPALSPNPLPTLPVGLFRGCQLPASLLPSPRACPSHWGGMTELLWETPCFVVRGLKPAKLRAHVLRTPDLQTDRPTLHPFATTPGRGALTLLAGAAQWKHKVFIWCKKPRGSHQGPRGPGCFPQLSSPSPAAPRGPLGAGSRSGLVSQARGRAEAVGGPCGVDGLPESLRLSPRLGPRGSGRGRGLGRRKGYWGKARAWGPRQPVQGFHPWLPIVPGKTTLHPPYRPKPLQPHASFQILHGARHPRAFAQSFLTRGYSSNFCFCTLPPPLFGPSPASDQTGCPP